MTLIQIFRNKYHQSLKITT